MKKIGATKVALLTTMASLLLGGCSASSSGNPILDLLSDFMPPSPKEAALDLFDIYDADKRRRAVALIAASPFGHEEPYVRTYRVMLGRGSEGQVLPVDDDATVRATCAKALGMHGTVEDAELIAPLLKDKVSYVRWQAAQALQRIHNPIAVQPLIETLRMDEDSDVRQACAAALGQYPQPLVYDTLVGALSDPNYGVVQAAHQSLRTLTGQQFTSQGEAWIKWGSENRSTLFIDQQMYQFLPYQKPASIIDKVRFWKEREEVQPKLPIGKRPLEEEDVIAVEAMTPTDEEE
ncbi:HEAT repeat domain-containing protein [Poriferisphaera corsica]|uniref:HEAT repeat domain-containing protein n=1 Tax=Poriferisphaera corsica TaxID=2528020 RepID=UPI00190D3882|nr:HEAT repeat domain-containing protein [Poriferisphaera corsica]